MLYSQPLVAQELCACGARAAPNFLMNCGTYHRQYLIPDVGHVVHRGDVIGGFGQNLLFGVAVRFELTTRDDIVTVKDLRHGEYSPLIGIRLGQRVGAGYMLGLQNREVNDTGETLRALRRYHVCKTGFVAGLSDVVSREI